MLPLASPRLPDVTFKTLIKSFVSGKRDTHTHSSLLSRNPTATPHKSTLWHTQARQFVIPPTVNTPPLSSWPVLVFYLRPHKGQSQESPPEREDGRTRSLAKKPRPRPPPRLTFWGQLGEFPGVILWNWRTFPLPRSPLLSSPAPFWTTDVARSTHRAAYPL